VLEQILNLLDLFEGISGVVQNELLEHFLEMSEQICACRRLGTLQEGF